MHGMQLDSSQVNSSLSWVPDADWRSIDDTITRLARKKGELEVELGRWLLAALRARVDRRLGFGSFAEYAGRRLGYDARTLKEKLRVAAALERLPRLRTTLASGARSWSAVREVTRVATPETEAAWVDATERRTVREIETLVAGRKPGELPSDPKDPLLATRRLVFELTGENFALVTEAFERMRSELGPSASNVEALVAMAELALGGRPAERPSYQTSLAICATCERTWARAGGSSVEVSAANAECARCDGEVIGFAKLEEGVSDGSARDGSAGDGGPATEAGAKTIEHERPHGRASAGSMIESSAGSMIESRAAEHETALAALDPAIGARGMLRLASRVFGVPLRSVTPQLKRAVRARDGGRCIVPGCTNFRFIELHHHRRRAAGGPNALENLHSLCTVHHRAVHEGLLSIEGSAAEGYVVRHANGTLYGAPRTTAGADPRGSPDAPDAPDATEETWH